jgi:hypothetical protein
MSAVQRRRQMGHKIDDVFMHYISAVSGVDIQNVINGRDPEFNTHLFKCQQHSLVQGSKTSAWTDFCRKTRRCFFPSCGYDLGQKGPSGAMTHINNHFVAPRRVSSICRWNHCGSKTLTKTKLLDHLTITHGIPLQHDSMKQARFCYECSEFFIHEDPDLFCGQIVCRGIIIFARKYMFCLADAYLTMAERYHGFTHAPSFFRHLQTHLQSIFECQWRCPHPKCSATIASEVAFWDHLRAVHGIARYKSGSGCPINKQACL